MKAREISLKSNNNNKNKSRMKIEETQKPSFRPAQDDTKTALQDPILRSDPIESEEAELRLPLINRSKSESIDDKDLKWE